MCQLSRRRDEVLRMVRDRPDEAAERILALGDKVVELEARLHFNSANSSKPPSSDGLKKPAPKSLPEKTGHKPGGKPGHRHHTLKQVENPDHTQTHRLKTCACGQCGGVSLKDAPLVDYERRQVFDLPPLQLDVTEHRAEIKCCPISGLRVCAAFPADVEAPVQYGPHFRALMLYLSNQHLLREWKFLFEQCGEIWTDKLTRFLLDWKSNPRARDGLEEDFFEKAHAQYQRIIAEGRRQHPRHEPGHGRTRQTKAANLLDRLDDYD